MALTLVSTVTVGSGGAASIEFTGIAGTGKDLFILVSGRTVDASSLVLRFNSDTANNYDSRTLRGDGSGADSNSNIGIDRITLIPISTAGDTANTFSNVAMTIANYTSSANKSISIDGVRENNATFGRQVILAGRYINSSAITTVTLTADFVQHSTASLYLIS
jgi:hypothetical protein